MIEYSIKVVNNGPDNALNVKVTELFDSSLLLRSFKESKGSYDPLKNEWYIDGLVSGGEETLLMVFEPISEGIFENIVSVTSDAFDTNDSDNEDGVLVKVVQNSTNDTDEDKPIIENQSITDNPVKSQNIDSPMPAIQKHSTANPIMLLIMVLLFSIVFSTDNMLKKR